MADMHALKAAIDSGDPSNVREVAAKLAPLGDRTLIAGGTATQPRHIPPIHHACDLAFEKKIDRKTADAIVEVLLDCGADPNAILEQNSDSMLISAVSLCCPEVAARLIVAGADVGLTGLFGATALHWASMLGFPETVDALIKAGAEVNIEDGEYASTPIGWAIQGWIGGTNGGTREQPECVALLVAAGGVVHAKDQARVTERAENAQIRQALGI